ncbi:hypothetical protein Bca4012_037428 [Brassica carinata]
MRVARLGNFSYIFIFFSHSDNAESLNVRTAVTFLRGNLSANSTSSSFHGVRIPHQAFARVPAAAISLYGRLLAVVMSKREAELKEIRAKTTEAASQAPTPVTHDAAYRACPNQVARILTVRREREIEEGIGKRLSRKLDRQWKKSIVVRPPPSLKKLQEEEAAEEAAEAAIETIETKGF